METRNWLFGALLCFFILSGCATGKGREQTVNVGDLPRTGQAVTIKDTPQMVKAYKQGAVAHETFHKFLFLMVLALGLAFL